MQTSKIRNKFFFMQYYEYKPPKASGKETALPIDRCVILGNKCVNLGDGRVRGGIPDLV